MSFEHYMFAEYSDRFASMYVSRFALLHSLPRMTHQQGEKLRFESHLRGCIVVTPL